MGQVLIVAGVLWPSYSLGGNVPKYTVTGGESGLSGVEISGQRYEPGETLEAPTKKVEWMIEAGILEAALSGKAAPSKSEEG